MIGFLLIAAWIGALSAHRFVLLAKYPNSRHRAASRAQAIALASVAVSFALVAVGAPNTLAGFFFVSGGLISAVMLATMIIRGIRPRRIRHAWRDIGDPEAWKGNRDLDA